MLVKGLERLTPVGRRDTVAGRDRTCGGPRPSSRARSCVTNTTCHVGGAARTARDRPRESRKAHRRLRSIIEESDDGRSAPPGRARSPADPRRRNTAGEVSSRDGRDSAAGATRVDRHRAPRDTCPTRRRPQILELRVVEDAVQGHQARGDRAAGRGRRRYASAPPPRRHRPARREMPDVLRATEGVPRGILPPQRARKGRRQNACARPSAAQYWRITSHPPWQATSRRKSASRGV